MMTISVAGSNISYTINSNVSNSSKYNYGNISTTGSKEKEFTERGRIRTSSRRGILNCTVLATSTVVKT